MHRAALRGQYKEVRRLVERGDDVNIKNKYGRTAVMYAAYSGHGDIVQYLHRIDAIAPLKASWLPVKALSLFTSFVMFVYLLFIRKFV